MAGIRELRPAPPSAPGDSLSLGSAVREALDLLGGARAVTVVVNDPQRATATASVLALLKDGLGGAPARALVATGSHHYDARRRRAFAERLCSALPFAEVAWHDCQSPDLAEVHGPAPWRCHPWLLDDNASVLAIGSCEPHYFAGITGAHKTATIGCAAHESIQANHAGALSDQARPCQLAGNPVHEGIAAMVGGLTARRDLVAVNLLQLGRRVLAAAAGGPLEALDRLAEAVRQAYVCTIDRPADALVLEVPGVLGRSFYQADKAIKNNEWSVRDGGCLVLVAACPDGVGQDDFLRLLRPCRSYDAIAESLRRQGYRLGDHKAVRLRYLTDHRGVRVAVVSDGLRRPDADLLGLVKAESPPAALEAAGIDPQSDRVYHVADAGHTCLVVEPPLPPPRLDSPETRPGGRF